MDEIVMLQTADGKKVRSFLGLFERSLVIKEMCSLVAPESPGAEYILPLHGIKTMDVLLLVLLWVDYHKDDEEPAWVSDETPVTAHELDLRVDDWDKEFVRDNIWTVCDLLDAADYLDMRWLFKLCAYKIELNSRQRATNDAALKLYQEKILALNLFDWSEQETDLSKERVRGLDSERPVPVLRINLSIRVA